MNTAQDQLGSIRDVDHLDELLSEPTEAVVETMGRMEGDILVLGVGGKMGPTIARMARRASDLAGVRRRVIGVARFSSPELPAWLERHGVEAHRADLLKAEHLAALPEASNILYMAGMKFGSTGNEATTWAFNVSIPTLVSERFGGPGHRFVVFSSGNIYGLVPVTGNGSKESDPPNPVGEYAMSTLGRERVFEHYAVAHGSPTALIRLNYAVEMRYGVLVDLAAAVWEGRTIDVSMGYVNVVWQGDANAMILRAFDHVAVPAAALNVAGPEILRVGDVCREFGRLMGKTARLSGCESPDALLNDAGASRRLLGEPRVGIEQLMQWIADWTMRGGPTLNKPTHFESRDGKF